MTTLRKHQFDIINPFSPTFSELVEEVDQWLVDNNIPHDKKSREDVEPEFQIFLVQPFVSATAAAANIVTAVKNSATYPAHAVSDPGHSHTVRPWLQYTVRPWLQYTMIDDESAILFKLQFGDYFDHEVKEQE